MSTERRHLGLGSTPLLCALFCCLFGGLLARFFQQQSLSRPWSLFSNSAGCLREMCMVSLISKVVVWLARLRIRVSSQRGWWCLDQACSVIADFSVSPLLVAAWCSFKCVPSALFVTRCTLAHNCRGSHKPLPMLHCRVSVLDPALARPFIRTA